MLKRGDWALHISSDLSPCDYYLFLTLKKYIAKKHFIPNEDTITVLYVLFETRLEP